MKYWLNLYTWNTWNEFLKAGGNITGFRDGRWRTVQKIKPGDIFLCYMTGISRFFAIEEVTGKPYQDESELWSEAVFSGRVPIDVLFSLEPQYAVPILSLKPYLSYFQNMKTEHSWTGHFRGSPNEIDESDALAIIQALEEAKKNPIYRDFDKQKLDRRVPTFETKTGAVSIPDNDEDDEVGEPKHRGKKHTSHEEIQWLLLNLGEQMGLSLWVAANDRSKTYNGKQMQSFSKMRNSLPIQFDAATNRTIELIDVLWLQGNTIVAAFEIEHTTAVYSGLLRMADLITMQPNINIPLFIVAPDERFDRVQKEINRPVFSKALARSLPEICRYIPYSELVTKIKQAEAGGFLRYLRPDFLDEIAESVAIDEF